MLELLERIDLDNPGILFLTFPKMETVHFSYLELQKRKP
jgi:hypothetical protein